MTSSLDDLHHKLMGSLVEFDHEEATPENLCVVKLHTTYWSDRRALHSKRSLTYLRRQCSGYNLLEEDVSNMLAEEVWDRINNINDCDDGVYQVVICNERRDWESGYIEDYEYELIPFNSQ